MKQYCLGGLSGETHMFSFNLALWSCNAYQQQTFVKQMSAILHHITFLDRSKYVDLHVQDQVKF